MTYQEKICKKDKIGFDTIFLMLYMVTLPLDFVNIGGAGSVSKLVSLLAVVSSIIKDRFKAKLNIRVFFIFVIYIFLNLFSGLYSKNQEATISRCTSLLLNYALILCCGSTFKNHRELNLIKTSLVLSGWITVALMLFYGKTHRGIGTRVAITINGVSQDPNYMCGYIMFAIMYYFNKVMSGEQKIFSLTAIIILIFTVLFAGSRGGLIAILCAFMSLYLLGSTRKNKMRNLLIIAISLFLIVSLARFVLPEKTLMRYSIQFTEEDAGAGRFELWQSLLFQFRNFGIFQKVFGVGASTIRIYLPNVAHNLWLETMFELGLLGLTVLAVMYLTFIRYSMTLQNKTYFATLMGYITLSMSTSLYTYKPIFSIFLILYLINNNKNAVNNYI